MRQKVTIEDIARETELSRGTVSRALNDRPDISLATKQRVLQACKKLNYAPSHAARSLATGRSFALIAFVRDLLDPHSSAILSAAIRRAEASGYLIHPVELPDAPAETSALIERVVNERVDGVILAASIDDASDATLSEALGDKPRVHVLNAGSAADSVAADWREAGRVGARFAARHAFQRVLLVDPGGRDDAREGFLEIALAEQIRVTTLPAPMTEAAVHALARQLDSVDAIISLGVSSARAAALAAVSAGHWPGEKMAILSIGDGPCAVHIRPTLSAVDVDPGEIGRRAADLILARLNGQLDRSPSAELVAPRLIERESTRVSGGGSARPVRS